MSWKFLFTCDDMLFLCSVFTRFSLGLRYSILVVDIRIFFSDNLGSHFACVYGAREDPESGSRTLFIADPYVVYTPKEVLTSASEFIEEMEDWTHAGECILDSHRFMTFLLSHRTSALYATFS